MQRMPTEAWMRFSYVKIYMQIIPKYIIWKYKNANISKNNVYGVHPNVPRSSK